MAVSHDLRTPLASIRAMIESMNDGVVSDPETVTRYLGTSLAEVDTLNQLVNDLFELSQLDAGLLELHLEAAPVQDLISDTLRSMNAQATARSLTLRGTVEGTPLPIAMDTRRVQRVLHNLIQNSIRHTPADGTIDVRVQDRGGVVQVEVADTGDGIPEREIQHVFERSYRTDRSRSRESGGAGLGLCIAKGDRGGAWGPHLGRECRGGGQHVHLHPAEGARAPDCLARRQSRAPGGGATG